MKFIPQEHRVKFENYIKAVQTCKEKKANILVANIHVLGDTTEEVETNIELAMQEGITIVLATNNATIRPSTKKEKQQTVLESIRNNK